MTLRANARVAGVTPWILPPQRAGLFAGALNWATGVTWFMWLPMLVFELTLALWFIVKGVAAPAQRVAA